MQIERYRNVAINVSPGADPEARFYTEDGEREPFNDLKAPTLEGLKAQIDKLSTKKVVMRDGLRLGGRYGDAAGTIERVRVGTVLPVPKGRYHYSNAQVWITLEDKGREKVNASSVFVNTEDNLKRAEQWSELQKQAERLRVEASAIVKQMVSFSPEEESEE